MKHYALAYVMQVLLLVMHVKLNVRKWAYIKHVRNHNSQNVKIRYILRIQKTDLVSVFLCVKFNRLENK